MKKITFNVDPEDFVLRHIFECGQCFRWDPVNEDSMAEDETSRDERNGAIPSGSKNAYIGIASGRVALVSLDVSGDASKDVSNDISCDTGSNASGKEATLLIEQLNTTEGSDDESDISFWNNYFDLDTDYGEIKQVLAKDETIRRAIPFGHGIRILRQDPWETTVSFIISQNNNIPRIKRNIRDLSQLAGEKVVIDNRTIGHATGSADQVNKDNLKGIAEDDWYEIPSPEVLAQMTVEDLAPVRLGYRARYLIETAQCVCERGISVLYDDLDSLCGVGPKVASCIRLFGLDEISSFPIDVWVKRVMKELYGIEKPSEMAAFAEKTFGEYGGIAQQYLFYYMRENK
jgi:N-glycosylase/DNA lyase